jgi:hypothetical protein
MRCGGMAWSPWRFFTSVSVTGCTAPSEFFLSRYSMLFDVTRSYVIPFWGSLACLVVSVFIVLASNRVVTAQKGIERN